MVFAAEVGDAIVAHPADKRSLLVAGPFGQPLNSGKPWENLVIRAHDALGSQHGFDFTVTKRIPVAAGLGGGSADAAATLRLLNRALDLRLTNERLAEIGSRLGADVPMCLLSRPLLVHGVGEQLTAVTAMPPLPLVLACPPVALRTVDVFRALVRLDDGPLPPIRPFDGVDDVLAWLRGTRNDLAEAATRVSPEAASAAAAIASDPDCLLARMTGSGPAAFGVFATRVAADRAASRLQAAERGWWVRATMTGGA